VAYSGTQQAAGSLIRVDGVLCVREGCGLYHEWNWASLMHTHVVGGAVG